MVVHVLESILEKKGEEESCKLKIGVSNGRDSGDLCFFVLGGIEELGGGEARHHQKVM